MPKNISCGLMLYSGSVSSATSDSNDGLRVLLAHPGGPYFARKDAGAWSIPKGLVEDGEDFSKRPSESSLKRPGTTWRTSMSLYRSVK